MERQGLYTHFSACCGARQGRLYSLVLEGERGEAPLGVPEWQDGCFVLKRTLANHAWSGIGVVQRASLYVRGAAESGSAAPEEVVEEGWILLRHPEYFFRTLSPQLSGVPDCYWKPECPLKMGIRSCCPAISALPASNGCGERPTPFLPLTRRGSPFCRRNQNDYRKRIQTKTGQTDETVCPACGAGHKYSLRFAVRCYRGR